MTTIVSKGTNRPGAQARTAKHAQRTPLPARTPRTVDGAVRTASGAEKVSPSRSGQMKGDSAPPSRLIGYARVSTREQANGYGIDAQRDLMEQWCAASGAVLVAFHIDVISTRRTDRMLGRSSAIDAIAAGAADGLLVRAIDRATRSVLDGARLQEQCALARIRLLTVDGYDSADENTQFTADIKIAMAQEERRLISRRTREGLARARAAGQTLGARPKVDGATVERIAELRDAGETFRAIARTLDAEGVPTPGGALAWRPATVAGVCARRDGSAAEEAA